MSTINIADLDHAEVLAALFNNSRQQGMGFTYTEGRSQMTAADARDLLKRDNHFDYLRGRVMKVSIEDNLDPWGYDRDNGPGAAERAIAPLRAKAPAFVSPTKAADADSSVSAPVWPLPIAVMESAPAPEPAFASGGAGGGVQGASVSASPMWEVGAVVLGYVGVIASWRRPTADYSNRNAPMLVIQTCASADEGPHEPAASVTIASREGLIALRSAIDEALCKGGAA